MYDYYVNYTAIEPYTMGDLSYNYISLTTTYLRGYGLILRVTPMQRTTEFDRCNPFGETELEMGFQIVRDMKRFSQTKLDAIHDKVKASKEAISALWNQRDFDAIKNLLTKM